ncbi:hypothetical protein JL722_6032 [Aureococcus anophagefferens]|nr:hypothetical protein JL722_6032 [Aureococcus anophagefferens]
MSALWRLPDGVASQILRNLDGKSLVRSGRSCRRLRQLTHDGGDAPAPALSLAGQTWKALCDARGWRQPGARSGWVPWSRVYRGGVCIECAEPGGVTINDPSNSLGFAWGRYALCARCIKPSAALWRLKDRPDRGLGDEAQPPALPHRDGAARARLRARVAGQAEAAALD